MNNGPTPMEVQIPQSIFVAELPFQNGCVTAAAVNTIDHTELQPAKEKTSRKVGGHEVK